uniref:ribonuclease H n=1 Tax=Anolis carolinensis TaxID=28377 RepID=A0A803TV69_ANOCA
MEKDRGRPKAGLAILLSTSLGAKIKSVDNCSHIAMACHIEYGPTQILLVNVYIPPSPKKLELTRTWEELEDYIVMLESRFPKSNLIVTGDFNARLGPDNTTLFASKLWHLEELEDHLNKIDRKSKDNKINLAGICLAQLTSRLALNIINGDPKFERCAEFTYISGSGSSVIDYVLVANHTYKHIENFTTVSRTESDHLPISYIVSLPKAQRLSPQHYLDNSTLDIRRNRLRWDTKKQNKPPATSDPFLLEELGKIIAETESAEEAISKYSHLTEELIVSGKKLVGRFRTQSQGEGTTDTQKECAILKKKLNQIYQSYRAENSQNLPKMYYTIKKQYKAMLVRNKREKMNRRWDALVDASLNNNSKQFWTLVTGMLGTGKTSPKCHIPVQVWEKYFTILYGSNEEIPRREWEENPVISFGSTDAPQWSPVTGREIKSLISSLKNGKAPGPDQIAPEHLKSNISWWTAFLAPLFTHINRTALIPAPWSKSIIIPIYKKGDKNDPANYRPISLLSVVGKLYSRHLYNRLLDWLDSEKIIGEEQAGFRKGRSTIDHCIVLNHLAEKYQKRPYKGLYTAFIDLKAAFDSVPRNLLWQKLQETTIDKRLLWLIKSLYSDTTTQVRCGVQGNLSKPIAVNRGVRQGCILAPILFNLYLNDLAAHVSLPNGHPPKISSTNIPLLLYADDAALISYTMVGLKRVLRAFYEYCEKNQLKINYSKTKIMIFSKKRARHNWYIGENLIQQVSSFKYLGVTFQASGSWGCHQKMAIQNALSSSKAIIRFFYTKGGQYIPAAIKVFQAKVTAQLLYAIPVWITGFSSKAEQVQSGFLRKLFAVPNCVPSAVLRLESGTASLKSTAWRRALGYWIERIYKGPEAGYIYLIQKDLFKSHQIKALNEKFRQLGLSENILRGFEYKKTVKILAERISDIDKQTSMTQARSTCSPLTLGPNI